MRKFLKITGFTFGALLLIVLVRWLLAPAAPKFLDVKISTEESSKLSTEISKQLIDFTTFSDQLSSSRIWLVGEEHFYNETISFFLKMLETIPYRKKVLLLELPEKKQEFIDAYMANGDEHQFDLIWEERSNLPYYNILRWAYKNKNQIVRVVAMDENQWHINLMRALLTDTRNETMADAIIGAYYNNPKALVVAYGGSMHMLKDGRYLYDMENRRPVGYRLLKAGLPSREVRSVILSGQDQFPLSKAFPRPGIVSTGGVIGNLPIKYFFETPIFMAETAGVVFDYFVHVGSLTNCKGWMKTRTTH